ncbi:hypothetical protein [Bradyrhizobium sp.]|uniref:hypothetical protein n=1 Tax=Bradyrhizobium sp. TaxID=376 RepID=UPI0040380158
MANAVMQAHHGLLQDVGIRSDVLAALIADGRFSIDAPDNLLFLPNDTTLAQASGTVRHAGNHAPVGDAQKAIFDEFGRRDAGGGKTYADLMGENPATLTEAERTLRSQIFDQAEALAADLRDYTNKAIIDGRLTLTKTDPKYAGMTDAAADAAWHADIERVYGSAADGFSEFQTERQALSAFRAEDDAIEAA